MTDFFIRLLIMIRKAGVFFTTFSILLVIVLRWLPVSYTPLMFTRLFQQEKKHIDHQWVAFGSIPNNLQLAVVCCEDQRFLTHHGFDFEEIKHAQEEAEDGGRHRGASTISQQTAKNVFLWPSSNYLRKGLEVWFTVLIEALWDKQRIMEVYLNSIEFGDGVYGCEAASQHFFHKDIALLSNSEAARLAVVLPLPRVFHADARSGHVVSRMNWALGQMRNYGNTLVYESEVPVDEKSRKGK